MPAAQSAGGEAVPVDTGAARPVRLDAVEHAVANPATTADISSTSLPGAPATGVVDAYNLSAVDLGSFDDSGYLQVIDSLDGDVLGLTGSQDLPDDRDDQVAGAHLQEPPGAAGEAPGEVPTPVSWRRNWRTCPRTPRASSMRPVVTTPTWRASTARLSRPRRSTTSVPVSRRWRSCSSWPMSHASSPASTLLRHRNSRMSTTSTTTAQTR